MKIAFWLGLVAGFCGVLAAAHFYPWVVHTRLPSHTSVVANGGRAERFLIRLPADRIDAFASDKVGLRSGPKTVGAALPSGLAERPLLVEHFKVRDAAGNVIGLAARHWSDTPDGAATAWSLLIPSRGALLLTAPGEARAALDAALRNAGYVAGTPWSGELHVDLGTGRKGAGVFAAGSEEFSDLQGRYSEIWTVTGVSDTGEVRGTIELDTVSFHSS